MSTIHKKILPEYFEKIMSGQKKLELRLADFEINEGDTLILEEFDKDKNEYTGRNAEVTATYILKTKGQKFWPQEEVDKYGFQIIQFEQKNSEANRPKVGVGVMIFKDGKILLGKRKNAHGAGEYSFPGGHLEHLESIEDCARREVSEECGLEIENIRFQFTANVIKYAPKHYLHIGVTADWKNNEPQILEPDKSESWNWYDIDQIPQPLFETCKLAILCHKTGKNYLDIKNIQ